MATIQTEIKSPKSKIFRRMWVKRRLSTTGLFETSWQDITKDVKRWGTISKSIDYIQYSKVRFNDVSIVMANDRGLYNPEDDEASFWYGYAAQQRTLVKIEAGFTNQTLGSSGIYTNTEFPSDPTIFVGVIQGDLMLSDSNEVTFGVKPLLQIFRDFSTRNLTGFTTTGMTANQFITMLRDQTDGSSNFIFRPFFGDTTTYWDYTSSSITYVDITNTITSARVAAVDPQNDFYQMNCWEAIEKLAQAENLVPYITRTGIFTFGDRLPNTTTAAYQFFGRGFQDYDYGITVKKVNSYSKKFSDYYSKVSVKWLDAATTTAIVNTQTSLVVNSTNTAWLYGQRSFDIENLWIGTVTSAVTLANALFTQVSTINTELDFVTSFVPHLELLDRIQVSYESSEKGLGSRWDLADWADNTTTTDLYWSNPIGDAIRFSAKEFKLVAIELNLDNLESRFVGLAI